MASRRYDEQPAPREAPRPAAGQAYRGMTVAAKQAFHRERMREPDVECPLCGTRTAVADLLRHVESTCPRQRQTHPLARWVTWREAIGLGVPGPTLWRWVRKGLVQASGPLHGRRYLLRDVVRQVAARRVSKVKLAPGSPGEPRR